MKARLDAAERITIRTQKTRAGTAKRDRYGRFIATVFADGVDLCARLVAEGHAEPATYSVARE